MRSPRRTSIATTAAVAAVTAALCLSGCGAPDFLERARSGDDALQEPEPKDSPPSGSANVPLGDGADWIQLKSGEWLRGELRGIRQEVLDFESDELDELSLDLADVRQIRSQKEDIALATGNRVFEGRLVVDGDKVWIVGDSTVQLRREELLTIVPIDGEKTARFDGKVSLGVTGRSGNTDQVDFSAFVELERETARSRASFRYTGFVSAVSEIETANNHRVTALLDTLINERLFVTVPGLEVYRDRFQNIAWRITPYAALGFELVDTPTHDWRVSIGPGYQYTELNDVGRGEDKTTASAAIFFSSNYDWEITKDIDLDIDYTITAPVPDVDQFNHTLLLALSVDLTDNLDLDVTFIWDRVNSPVAGDDGQIPVPDDLRTTVGIGWQF